MKGLQQLKNSKFKQMNEWKKNSKRGKNQTTVNVTKLVDYKQDKMLEEKRFNIKTKQHYITTHDN
jgi:hypothetical protein